MEMIVLYFAKIKKYVWLGDVKPICLKRSGEAISRAEGVQDWTVRAMVAVAGGGEG